MRRGESTGRGAGPRSTYRSRSSEGRDGVRAAVAVVADRRPLRVLVVSVVGFMLVLAGEHGPAGWLLVALVLVAARFGWWRLRRSDET